MDYDEDPGDASGAESSHSSDAEASPREEEEDLEDAQNAESAALSSDSSSSENQAIRPRSRIITHPTNEDTNADAPSKVVPSRLGPGEMAKRAGTARVGGKEGLIIKFKKTGTLNSGSGGKSGRKLPVPPKLDLALVDLSILSCPIFERTHTRGPKSLAQLPDAELCALAVEMNAMRREARSRAQRMEQELRKICTVIENTDGLTYDGAEISSEQSEAAFAKLKKSLADTAELPEDADLSASLARIVGPKPPNRPKIKSSHHRPRRRLTEPSRRQAGGKRPRVGESPATKLSSESDESEGPIKPRPKPGSSTVIKKRVSDSESEGEAGDKESEEEEEEEKTDEAEEHEVDEEKGDDKDKDIEDNKDEEGVKSNKQTITAFWSDISRYFQFPNEDNTKILFEARSLRDDPSMTVPPLGTSTAPPVSTGGIGSTNLTTTLDVDSDENLLVTAKKKLVASSTGKALVAPKPKTASSGNANANESTLAKQGTTSSTTGGASKKGKPAAKTTQGGRSNQMGPKSLTQRVFSAMLENPVSTTAPSTARGGTGSNLQNLPSGASTSTSTSTSGTPLAPSPATPMDEGNSLPARTTTQSTNQASGGNSVSNSLSTAPSGPGIIGDWSELDDRLRLELEYCGLFIPREDDDGVILLSVPDASITKVDQKTSTPKPDAEGLWQKYFYNRRKYNRNDEYFAFEDSTLWGAEEDHYAYGVDGGEEDPDDNVLRELRLLQTQLQQTFQTNTEKRAVLQRLVQPQIDSEHDKKWKLLREAERKLLRTIRKRKLFAPKKNSSKLSTVDDENGVLTGMSASCARAVSALETTMQYTGNRASLTGFTADRSMMLGIPKHQTM